jgi:hypothetical protein
MGYRGLRGDPMTTDILGWLRVVIMIIGATATAALLITAHMFLAVLIITATVTAMIALFELADHIATT